MATYEYKCPVCQVNYIVERSITSDEILPMCDCGQQMNRVWNATPTVFKATGFYSVENPRG
jgi:putative FmdB family regulatory protein